MLTSGWIIYDKVESERNKAYIEWFISEAQKQNMNLQLMIRERIQIGVQSQQISILYDHQPIELPQFAIVRTVEPLLNKHLELLGLKVFNSSKVSMICNHKARTYTEMNLLNIPFVDTLFTKKSHLNTEPPMVYPFVIKESTGRSGKQVFYIENQQDWKTTLANLTSEELIIQTADVQLGKDLRVFVLGKRIIGAVLRQSEDDFRANYNLGGTATWYPLNDEEKKLVKKIIHSFEFDLVGIDFLMGTDGKLLLNEIEDVVGSRILSAVSDINLLQKYVSHIKTKLNNR